MNHVKSLQLLFNINCQTVEQFVEKVNTSGRCFDSLEPPPH